MNIGGRYQGTLQSCVLSFPLGSHEPELLLAHPATNYPVDRIQDRLKWGPADDMLISDMTD